MLSSAALAFALLVIALPALAQVPPSAAERAGYTGLFAASASGDAAAIARLVAAGTPVDARDAHGRTALHVAAFGRQRAAIRALVAAGADANALDADRYDIVTIAAVADDVETLEAALDAGARATNITSRYDGTALIAAAHLGHDGVVRMLVKRGAPLDHVNNLGWTALIESIVLGNGGPRHVATMKALIDAGANVNLGDRNGQSPLSLASARGFRPMVALLTAAGAK
jgi:ankyrin repeat protein